MLESAYDEIYKILVPYGTYIQQGETARGTKTTVAVEGRVKGFPVELVLSIITGVVIGSFFKGFFAELGEVSAQKVLEKITSNMKSEKKFDTKKFDEIETLIRSIKLQMREIPPEELEKYILQAGKEVERELESEGIPAYKAEVISSKISLVLKSEIVKRDINNDLQEETT